MEYEKASKNSGGRPAEAASDFLRAVFGKAVGPERNLVIFTLPDASSRGFTDIVAAARHAARRAERSDVCVGVGLYRCAKRGSAQDVSALVGLWADVDLAHAVHKKVNLPRNGTEAMALLKRLPHWPSSIVHSGHGLQCWWLFREPLAIRNDRERRSAGALAKGWTDCIRRQARSIGGWDVDATGDLARVLRLPGTMNRKGDVAVPVRLLEPDILDGGVRRYMPEDFRALVGAAAEEPGEAAQVGLLRLDPNSKPPAAKFAFLLAEDEKFRRAWERNRPDLQDQSPSGYDMSLASIAVASGWENQEIVDLLVAARRKHGDDLKLRLDYYARTLARARGHRAEPCPRARGQGDDGIVHAPGRPHGRIS